MRNFIVTITLFLLSCRLIAVDYTHYLADRELKQKDPATMVDKFGNSFRIIEKSEDSIKKFKTSILKESVGIGNLPLYPSFDENGRKIFLQPIGENRGQRDIPSLIIRYMMGEVEKTDFFAKLEGFTSEFKFIGLFYTELNLRLTQFELLKESDLALMQISPDEAKAMIKRVSSIRSDLIDLLKARRAQLPLAFLHQSKKSQFDRPLVSVPNFEDSKKTDLDNLWFDFFRNGDHAEVQNLTAVRTELRESSERIYFVGNTSAFANKITQSHLNPMNKKTLVVVPVNDREAMQIEKIARQVAASVFVIDEQHGVKLENYVDKIIARAKEIKAERIIVSEVPPETLDTKLEEKIARETGAEYVIIDHHDNGAFDRYNALSSLEQFAEAVGFDIGTEQKKVGVTDRSFVYGLAALGLTKEEVIDGFKTLVTAASNFPNPHVQEEVFGKLYVLHNPLGSMGQIGSAFALRSFPSPPNILMINENSIKFNGSPEIAKKLIEELDIFRPEVEAYYSGGDKFRSMFMGIKGLEKVGKEKIVNKINEILALKTPISAFDSELINEAAPLVLKRILALTEDQFEDRMLLRKLFVGLEYNKLSALEQKELREFLAEHQSKGTLYYAIALANKFYNEDWKTFLISQAEELEQEPKASRILLKIKEFLIKNGIDLDQAAQDKSCTELIQLFSKFKAN